MAHTNIIGLRKAEANKLCELLHAIPQEKAPKQDCTISFVAPVNLKRQNSLWYRGSVAIIIYRGHTFSISAIGEVRAFLRINATGNEVAIIIKSTHSDFYEKVRRYLPSDHALEEALLQEHEKYSLEKSDGNWWEVSLSYNGEEISWVADADNLFPVIINTLQEMDDYLDNLK